ncbi:MAG: urease accessory protein UreE [Cyanobacteria bacterium J06573_11]
MQNTMQNTTQNTVTHQATIIADTYLGNVNEQATLAEKMEAEKASVLQVRIDRCDRIKGRIFATALCGRSIGIIKDRNWLLRDGDVLATQSAEQTTKYVLVSLKEQQVIAIRFDPGAHNHAVTLMQLGHVLGNHHWPISVCEDTLYVELVSDASLVASTVKEVVETLNIQGLRVTQESKSTQQAIDFSAKAFFAHHHAH